MSERVLLLFSGGIESAHLLYKFAVEGAEVHPLYVRAGHRWEEAELAAVSGLCAGLDGRVQAPAVLSTDLSDFYRGHWSVAGEAPGSGAEGGNLNLPGRNAFLLGAAAVLCELRDIRQVVHGKLATSEFLDATQEFFRTAERLLALSTGEPAVLATPLAGWSKVQVIRASAGVPLERTWSCVAPRTAGGYGFLHCGICGKCGERRSAFAAAGVEDPTEYA